MRIALVTESFLPTVDDATTTLKATVDRLVDTGHEVRVVAPGPGLASYRGCRVVRVRASTKPRAQVRAALDELRPDVVHVADPGRLGRAALDHAARLGVPSVVVQHSPVDARDEERWRRRVADRADTLLVTAGWMAEHLATQGVRADLWTPGVDTAAFSPTLRDPHLHAAWSRGGTQVVVGYVGALRKRHGVRRLVDLDGLPGVRPVVVGDGPQRDWLRARMSGARFSSALGTGDLAVALATLDVLVHPGTHETCGHVLRAAAASGVPVVAPRAGGACDVVRPLETGLLHDPADPRGLADAVLALASDRRRGLLGARARELAVTRGWPAAVDELVARHYPARARAA